MIIRYRGMQIDALEVLVYLVAGAPRRLSLMDWLRRRRLKLLMAKRSPSDPDYRRFKGGVDDILTALFRIAGALTLASGSAVGLAFGHVGIGKDAPEFTQFYLHLADVGQSALLWSAPVATLLWIARFVLRHFLIVGHIPTFMTILTVVVLPGIAIGIAANGVERPLRLASNINQIDLFLRCNSQERLARIKTSGYEVFPECREWLEKKQRQTEAKGQAEDGPTGKASTM